MLCLHALTRTMDTFTNADGVWGEDQGNKYVPQPQPSTPALPLPPHSAPEPAAAAHPSRDAHDTNTECLVLWTAISQLSDQQNAIGNLLGSITTHLEVLSTVPVIRQGELSQPAPSSAPMPHRPTPKFSEPRKFNSKANQVKPFLSEVESGLYLQRHSLVEDHEKILWTSGYFGDGNTKSWWLGVLDSPGMSHLLDSFTLFKDTFIAHFSDPHISAAALDKLKTIRQSASCATYVAAFREQLPYVQLTEQTKIDMFKSGLKSSVRNLMVTVRPVPTNFDDYAKITINFDNEQHCAEKELRQHQQPLSMPSAPSVAPAAPVVSPPPQTWSYPTPTMTPSVPATTSPAATSNSDVVPMKIDALRQCGQISTEELQCRITLGLCRYCGGKNHTADHFPNKSTTAYLRDLQHHHEQRAPTS